MAGKILTRTTLAFLFLTQMMGCMNTHIEHRKSPEVPAAPWSVSYHDGSGNGFYFSKESDDAVALFEYSPVKPEYSSSGLYSGGEAWKGVLNEEQGNTLWKWIARLGSDGSGQTHARVKGSGAFRLMTPDGEREFLVTSGTDLSTFDELLHQLLRD